MQMIRMGYPNTNTRIDANDTNGIQIVLAGGHIRILFAAFV